MDDTTWEKLGIGLAGFCTAVSAYCLKKPKGATAEATAALESRIAQLERDRQRLDEDREHMQTTIEKIQGEHEVTKRTVNRLKNTQDERIDVLTESVNRCGELLQDLARLVKRSQSGPPQDATHAPSRLT